MKIHISKEWVASIYIVIAGCCWGIIGYFSRALTGAKLDAMQISTLRVLVAAVFLFIIIFVTDRSKLRVKIKDMGLFVGSGVLSIAFFNICYFISIKENTLSLAAILLYTAPSFVVMMSKIVFKEKITKQKLLALVTSFAGSFFAVGIFSESIQTTVFGLAVGLGSGIGYALYSIFSRLALNHYNWLTVSLYTFLMATAALLPFSRPVELYQVISHTPLVGANILALGLLCTLVPYLLYTKGLEHLEVGKAALLTFVEPVVATIVGIVVFHEKMTVFSLGGILLIVVSLVILNMNFKTLNQSVT